jgi:hypothetical protein
VTLPLLIVPASPGPEQISRRTIKGLDVVEFNEGFSEQTIEFLKRCSPDHPELAERESLTWQKCRRYLALFQGKIVGHIAQIEQRFLVGKVPLNIGWAATLVLDTSNPLIQTFAGTALLDKVTTNTDVTFAAVGVVPEIEQTHVRRGYAVRRDMATMYARFLNPGKSLQFVGKSPRFDRAVRIANFFLKGTDNTPANIRSVNRFDSVWDSIWSKILASRFDIFGDRSAAFLNYKIAQPHKHYHCFVHTRDTENPDGYMICRVAESKTKGIRLLKVCDLVGSPRATRRLLAQARVLGATAQVDAIVAIASKIDRGKYRSAGLWISRAYPVVLPPGLFGKLNLSFFDSDLDNLW